MFKLPNISYNYDALGVHISADIMKLHHQKHHQAYVDKLNGALEGVAVDGSGESDLLKLGSIISRLDDIPEELRTAVRNHGGGHYNHTLFWSMMSPNGGGQPTGRVASLIEHKYGSFQEFVDVFTLRASQVFGSGWCWLLADGSIVTTANQDNPIMRDTSNPPILGLDVWEHAYYLDYKNVRPDYIKAWWNVVDWQYVEVLYDDSVAK